MSACCPDVTCPHDVVCEPRATTRPPALLPSPMESDGLARTCDLCPRPAREWRDPSGEARCEGCGSAVTVPAPRPSAVEQYIATRTVAFEHKLSARIAEARGTALFLAMSADEREAAVHGYIAVVIGRWKAGA